MTRLFFIIGFIFIMNPIFSQSKITFINNTGKLVQVAYAYYSKSNNCWISKGWKSINAYDKLTVNFGDFDGNMYVRGRSGAIKSWNNGDANFCVDATQNFEIHFADTKSCGLNKVGFSKLKLSKGDLKIYFD